MGQSRAGKRETPTGLWTKCDGCSAMLYRSKVEEKLDTCPECGEHFRIGGARRIAITADPGTFEEFGHELKGGDPLGFTVDGKSYGSRLVQERKRRGVNDACITGFAQVKGLRAVLAAMDFTFFGGSMGSIVGEKVALALETARDRGLPCIVFSSSGGARMHEGALSLMQMAKTSAAVAYHRTGRAPFISVLTDPTTGGVTASFAALGDVIIAEPKALIGFAGPRVIQETIRSELPPGFQRSEFLLQKGFVDLIVHRLDMRDRLAQLLEYCL
ncbi:MAG: acetyl-CoA carboxylase carboxyltransferase subunit beta [Planctomycetaceae bacterium]|nr:acetyl-CoA carboxylase, carboxyltransferase subunit beta [Planctomycetota bacterium]NUN51666.1 acetyl-CoA carboxylase carboxyltransferase subunit beta [Planctomycetaceae bacterium]